MQQHLATSWQDWFDRQENFDTRVFERVIGFCGLLKVSEVFPYYKSASLFEFLICICLFATSTFLVFEKKSQAIFAIQFLFSLFLFWGSYIFSDYFSVEKFSTHHWQLFVICNFFLMLRENKFSRKLIPSLAILKLLLLIIYACGVFVKTNLWYFSGIQAQQIFMTTYGTSDGASKELIALLLLMTYLSLAIEIAIPILLLTRFKKHGIFLGLVFHVIIFLSLPVSIFSFLMIGLLSLFWNTKV
ncbi:MAG: hypothetical protein V4654_04905 [Bdellovibrionota bacterium]